MSAVIYFLFAVAAGAPASLHTRRPPYAAPACALGALVASVLISLPLNDTGPRLLGVALLPAAIGALAGALATRLMLNRLSDGVE
jgi:hypothetical protein